MVSESISLRCLLRFQQLGVQEKNLLDQRAQTPENVALLGHFQRIPVGLAFVVLRDESLCFLLARLLRDDFGRQSCASLVAEHTATVGPSLRADRQLGGRDDDVACPGWRNKPVGVRNRNVQDVGAAHDGDRRVSAERRQADDESNCQ